MSEQNNRTLMQVHCSCPTRFFVSINTKHCTQRQKNFVSFLYFTCAINIPQSEYHPLLFLSLLWLCYTVWNINALTCVTLMGNLIQYNFFHAFTSFILWNLTEIALASIWKYVESRTYLAIIVFCVLDWKTYVLTFTLLFQTVHLLLSKPYTFKKKIKIPTTYTILGVTCFLRSV